jgi:mono/diheme cytochrome c family protein
MGIDRQERSRDPDVVRGVCKRTFVAATCVIAATALAGPPRPTKALLAAGKAVYEGAAGCVACHGVTGEGNGPVAFAIKPPPRNFVRDAFKAGDTVEQVFRTITNGLPNTRMVGYPNLAEADRWALASYVVSFRPARKL